MFKFIAVLEAEKCTREQLSDIIWRTEGHHSKARPLDTCLCDHLNDVPDLYLDTADDEDKEDKAKHYEQLQQNVDKLEYEVQSFLNSLRSQKSRVKNT